MKKGNATIAVVLSKAQIRELLFETGKNPRPTPDLKQARDTLRRTLREDQASNDPQPSKRRA